MNQRESWVKTFVRNALTYLSPETFAVMHAGLAFYYASIVLNPTAVLMTTEDGGSVLPPLARLSPFWGYVMVAVGLINFVVFALSLAFEKRPHLALYAALTADALMYSYVTVSLLQVHVPFGLLKVFGLHSCFAVFFCIIVKARQYNEVERENEPPHCDCRVSHTPDVKRVESLAQECVSKIPKAQQMAAGTAAITLLQQIASYNRPS